MGNDRPGHLERRAGSGAAGFRCQKTPSVASRAGLRQSRFPFPVIGAFAARDNPVDEASGNVFHSVAIWRQLKSRGWSDLI